MYRIGRCITVCNEVQTVYALTFAERGIDTHILILPSVREWQIAHVLIVVKCTGCPTGALHERSEPMLPGKPWALDPEKTCDSSGRFPFVCFFR